MIKEFHVQNLFGLFNNTIKFNDNEKITIILGPNGCGKTTMLKMFDAIIKLKHDTLLDFKFEYIILKIDNEELKIQKNLLENDIQNKSNEKYYFPLSYYIDDKKLEISKEEMKNQEITISELVKKNYLNDYLIHTDSNLMTFRDNYERIYFDTREKINNKNLMLDSIPAKVKFMLTNYSSNLISTNRLTITIRNETYSQSKSEVKNTIQVYSDDLKLLLKNKLTDYANLSQKLDAEFPLKVLDAVKLEQRSNTQDIENKILEINNLRNKLILSGVLENNDKLVDVDLYNVDNSIKSMLTIYYQDTEKKLHFLSDVAEKLLLFLDMANQKLGDNKKISVNSTNGIQIMQRNSIEPIKLEDLSSGEQQEIILLYRLIFNSNKNDYLLIDEPEISLHVSWQRQFLNDLERIIKINNCNIIVATHSPQIINENWDLVNCLGEVE